MANKKINQLVSKTSILSTDLFGIGDATTGQLFKKTIAELQAAIGGAVISVNGLVGTVVLDTDDIQELATPTNKYFTDARARAAISLTVTGNSGASTYSSGTGVLNVPTYTLAGLGGISASFLSGTSGISYNSTTGVISYSGTVYTDASIRALFTAGTGITYNSSTGAISYSGTVYTDSSVRALISLTTTGNSGASTYNNTTGVINVPNYTLAGLGGISLTSLSGGTGITYNSTTGAISYSGTVYTDASVRALISAGTGISYNSTTGVITSTITQYTDALARASISITTTGTSGASTYNSTTGVLNVPQYQGAITLTTTGTSGAATFSSNTLNIPQYQAVLTNPVTGTGTSGYHAKWTSSSTLGNGIIYDNGTNVLIGTATGDEALTIKKPSGTACYVSAYNGTSGILTGVDSAGLPRIFVGSADALTFWTNSIERIRITSGGFVGINMGSTTIDQRLMVKGRIVAYGAVSDTFGSSDSLFYFDGGTTNNTSYSAIQQGVSKLGFWTYDGSSWGNRMVITSTGNVGIGTSSPAAKLEISDSGSGTRIISRYINTDTTNGNIAFISVQQFVGGGGNQNAYFGIDLNDNVRINADAPSASHFAISSSGNTLLGTVTNNGERLYVSGNIRATGTITANSDISLKKNLLKIENALEKIEQINGYTYELKENDSKRHGGVIAQEIDKVFPEIVNTGNDGLMGVEYGNISALLIEAIKEQNLKIKNLETLLASK